jgi:hypothetical protein
LFQDLPISQLILGNNMFFPFQQISILPYGDMAIIKNVAPPGTAVGALVQAELMSASVDDML